MLFVLPPLSPILRSLAVAFALALVSMATSAGPAAADDDLTGKWQVDMVGDFNLSCATDITQDGSALDLYLYCVSVLPPFTGIPIVLRPDGSFDKEMATFHTKQIEPTGFIQVSGVVGPSGHTMSGTWSICTGDCKVGTFEGTRAGVGGIAELPDADAAPLQASDSDRTGAGVLAASVAGAAALVAFAGAVLFGRKRATG